MGSVIIDMRHTPKPHSPRQAGASETVCAFRITYFFTAKRMNNNDTSLFNQNSLVRPGFRARPEK